MKRLTLNTLCTATVYETWEFEVPDDFELPDPGAATDGTEWIEWLDEDEAANTRFLTKITDEVDDEHDRQYLNHRIEQSRTTTGRTPS